MIVICIYFLNVTVFRFVIVTNFPLPVSLFGVVAYCKHLNIIYMITLIISYPVDAVAFACSTYRMKQFVFNSEPTELSER